MKKLMKKIKSNSFISKAVALLTIIMVIISSLTVSSFAAEESSAANEETDSITDVWTSVMNWITTSLGSVQGVFYSTDLVPTVYGEISGAAALRTVNLPLLSEGDTIFVNLVIPDYHGIVEATVTDSYPDNSAELYLIAHLPFGDQLLAEYNRHTPSGYGWTTSYQAVGVFTGYSLSSPGLTFLGTLAVIGVAIAIAFLLISVISRFLRLRG